MRHWFVPACLCLVAWSSAIEPNPKPSPEDIGGVSVVDKNAEGSSAGNNSSEPAAENTVFPNPATTNYHTADIAVDFARQSGDELELMPERPPLPPIRRPVIQRSYREVCDTLARAAQANNLPTPFFIRLLFQESGFRPEVVSRAGAQGVAQFMPDTSASMGVINPFDPVQAIPASARLLRDLFQQFGNLGLAAAAYNAGPKRIAAWLTKKGKLPQETQGYVKTITGRPAETWKVAAAGNPEMKLPRQAPCQEIAGLLAWDGPRVIPMPRPFPFRRSPTAPIRAMQFAGLAVSVKHSFANLAARGTGRQAVSSKQSMIEAKFHSRSGKDNKKAGKSVKLATAGAVK